MIDTESIEFHETYVNPYYGGLMGFNMMRIEVVSDTHKFISKIISLQDKLGHDVIKAMLIHDNWRPAKVGAWIIGLCQIKELEKDLIDCLTHSPIYCEHVIINLALLNSKRATNAINEFVTNKLDEILNLTKEGKEYKASDKFERYSILWVFNAIKYLDSINDTKNFETVLNSQNWIELKSVWHKISKSNPRAIGCYNQFIASENKDLKFAESIEIIKIKISQI